MVFSHIPVMLEEAVGGLDIKPDGVYVDCTAGGGGHSRAIAEKLNSLGRLVALDRDPEAVSACSERLSGFKNARVIHSNYSDLRDVLDTLGIDSVDGVLMDLGVSSHQLDDRERGFSYHSDSPLDMRMSMTGVSASDVVNNFSERQLADIIFRYGDEKFSRQIARNIVRHREEMPITTTSQLADIVRESIPQRARREKNPCRKTFQAIRIEVNGETEHLKKGLSEAFSSLRPHGRLAVITFHSLEDRLVKQQFAQWCRGCTCPPDFPQCVCGKKPLGTLVSGKPLVPSQREVEKNTRSRSAKLRIIERSEVEIV